MCTFLYLPNKIHKQTNCQCVLKHCPVYSQKLSMKLKMFLSPLFSRRCLAYACFLLNVSLDALIKKKHVFTDIENLKLEKYYVLFSAISLLIFDIL